MKKTKKKLSQAQLLKKYEKKMKPIILARDGNRCQVAGYRHVCHPTLVMDHRPAKRGKHRTFLDPRNLTTVCQTANYCAEFDPFVNLAIINVIKRREGPDTIDILESLSREIKRWYEDEIIEWIEKCRQYFVANKNGLPNERIL